MRLEGVALVLLASGCADLLGLQEPSGGGQGQPDGAPGADAPQTTSDAALAADGGPMIGALFEERTFIPTGMLTRAVAIADLDDDQHLDVVALNRGSSDVSVLPGLGNGSFMPKTDLAMGQQPEDLLVADLNGDGHDDLAVAAFGGSQVVIRYNSASSPGSFGAPVPVDVGVQPRGVASAQLAGDMRPDLLICHETGVAIFEQDGTGMFTLVHAVSPPIMSMRCGAAAGRLDGDSLDDVAFVLDHAFLARQDFATPGTFLTPVELALGPAPFQTVGVADVDGDGLHDMVFGGSPAGAELLVLQETGTPGQLRTPIPLDAAGADCVDVVVAPFGGGSLLDVAFASEATDQLVVMVDTSPAPVYTRAADGDTGDGPRGVAAGDLDEDGRTDVVTADNLSGGVSVFLRKP